MSGIPAVSRTYRCRSQRRWSHVRAAPHRTEEQMNLKNIGRALAIGTCLASSGFAFAGDRDSQLIDMQHAVLDKPPNALTAEDLLDYLDLALDEAITPEQARRFMSRLSPEQRLQFNEAVESLAERKIESRETMQRASKNQAFLAKDQGPMAVMGCDPAAQERGFCWLQMIERYTTSVIVEHQRPSWHQLYTTICDNDPGDADLVVYFPISSINPDNLMWGSSSSFITSLLDSSLLGFDFDNVGAHMCINSTARYFRSDAEIANSLTMYRKK